MTNRALIRLVTASALVVAASSALPAPSTAASAPRVHRLSHPAYAERKSDNSSAELVSVSPDHADVSGRNHVTLRGNMGELRAVYFGAKKANIISENVDGTTVVSAPKHKADTVRLKLVNADGSTVKHKKGVGTFTYRHDGKPKISTSRLPSATVGILYLAILRTADDRSGTWTGHVPDGLHLGSGTDITTIDGRITTASGPIKVPLTFTDTNGQRTKRTLEINTLPQRWREDSGTAGLPACTGTTCYRIGGSSDTQLEVYSESDGGAWNLAQEVPAPSEIGYFDGLRLLGFACGSATTCAAIGLDDENDNNPNASPDSSFAVTLHDGTWTATQLPTVDQITAVTCSGETCYAVGPGGPGVRPSSDAPDLLTLTDGSWSVSHPSLTSSGLTGLDLQAVGCSDNGICRAAGTGSAGGRPTLAVVRIAPDGATAVTTLPRPAGATGALQVNGVGCMSATDCIALAHYGVERPGPHTTYDAGRPYFARLHNGKWTAHPLVTPTGAKKGSVQVASLACNTTSACFAVGSARRQGVHEAYAVRFTPTRTTTFVPRFPDETKDVGQLQVASCAAAGDCYAGGFYRYAVSNEIREDNILAFAHLGSGSSTTATQRVVGTDTVDWGPLACADDSVCVGSDRTKTPAG